VIEIKNKQIWIDDQPHRDILPDESYTIEKNGRTSRIISRKHAKVDDSLVIRFKNR
jgi:hypothetical protein